jgi:DNA-binding NarL/FixJ family response regulator
MSTMLCIQISSSLQTQKNELEIFTGNEWTKDAEQILIQQIKEVLAVVRDNTNSVRLQIDLIVNDPSEVVFQIKKRLNQTSDVTVQNQKLSVREVEIIGLLMLGYTNQQIADKLFINFETVRSHRKNILRKTGAKNTAELISYYHQTFFDK